MRYRTWIRFCLACLLLWGHVSLLAAQPEIVGSEGPPEAEPPLPLPAVDSPPRPRLPLELSRFDDELRQLDGALGYEPPENRTVLICATTRTLVDDATAISKTPLLELTQGNFKSWQTATAELTTRAQALADLCRQNDILLYPVEDRYRAVKTGFDDLLQIRQ